MGAPLALLAPAKLNLFLHITGRRPDGYHALESLVAFAAIADRVDIHPADSFSFSVCGAFADGFSESEKTGTDNLAVQAALLFREISGIDPAVAVTLTKNLPLAAGLGGGSADAAAVVRGLCRFYGVDPALFTPDRLMRLGADVPVCYGGRAVFMGGAGEALQPVSPLPALWAVVVNPLEICGTADIFKARRGDFSAPETAPLKWTDGESFVMMLKDKRNDLTTAALSILPEIGIILKALEAQPDILLARMTGSGATCFGLCANEAAARRTAAAIQAAHPAWWVAQGKLMSSDPRIKDMRFAFLQDGFYE